MAARRKNIKSWQRIEYVKLFKKTIPCCVFCKTPWSKDVLPTLDHIVPMSAGGGHELSNLTLACEACNNLRGSIEYYTFKSNVTSPETRDEYREALMREGKDEELYKLRKQRNNERKEYIEYLRDLFDKDIIENECNMANAAYREAKRSGNVAKALDLKAKLISKQEELTLTCSLIRVKVKNRFCGKKFKKYF